MLWDIQFWGPIIFGGLNFVSGLHFFSGLKLFGIIDFWVSLDFGGHSILVATIFWWLKMFGGPNYFLVKTLLVRKKSVEDHFFGGSFNFVGHLILRTT